MSFKSPQKARQSSLQMSPGIGSAPKTPSRLSSSERIEKRTSQYDGMPGEFRSPPPLTNYKRGSSFLQSPARLGSSEQYSEAAAGDLVEVPGNHLGIVMYVGPIEGRQGTFLGVDLNEPDTDKGRNDGSHNGTRYFTAKAPMSGMFVPQGRCRIIDSHGRLERVQDPARPGSRQASGRPGSRLRSVSTRSFSGMSLSESPRLSSSEAWGTKGEGPNPEAAAFQRILNENARLTRELEESQNRVQQMQTANAVQAQEMEELMSTVSELELLQGPRGSPRPQEPEIEEMRAFIEDRERVIEDMRKEAEDRRTKFREVTEHQQATIDELKELHRAQLVELQEKHDDIEERLLSSAGEQFPQSSQKSEQLEALQAQLLELSDELDALVGQQERARQDIDIANSRIAELELENEKLLTDLADARAQSTNSTPIKTARRMASIEQLADSHPQKRQTIAFLENEIERLKNENEAHEAARADGPDVASLLAELEQLQDTVATLQTSPANGPDQSVLVELQSAQSMLVELQSALDTEKSARIAAENQCRQAEETLERTILHQVNTRSPRASRPPALSISTASASPELDLRSPRADRAPISMDLPSEGALYCEYCETDGHDIVSCRKVFGSNTATPAKTPTTAAAATTTTADAGLNVEDDDEIY